MQALKIKHDKKLLVLDDDNSIRFSLVSFFEDRDWVVLSAENAEDALEIVKNEKPNAGIIDIRLPVMDGNSFIFRANILVPSMNFIICTGSTEYRAPENIQNICQVSRKIFIKPVQDLFEIESELLQLFSEVKI